MSGSRQRLAIAVMTVVAIVGACRGGGSDDGDPNDTAAPADTPAAESTSTLVPPGVGSTPTIAPPTKERSGTTTTTVVLAEGVATDEGREKQDAMARQADQVYGDLQINASLRSRCVPQGGRQSITVKDLKPRSAVGYDSYYADGKTGLSEGFYGGNNGGNADDSGSWSDEWVISPAAPLGRVLVQIVAAEPGGDSGHTTAEFTVVEANEKC